MSYVPSTTKIMFIAHVFTYTQGKAYCSQTLDVLRVKPHLKC